MDASAREMAHASRRDGGALAYQSGRSAEEIVERAYMARGYRIAARRWRRRGTGEIDLVCTKDGALVFIEVKKARSHAAAAARLGARQIARLVAAAEAYLAESGPAQAIEMRFDVALVDGQGQIDLIENALPCAG